MTIRTKLMTEDDLEMADAFIEKTFYQDEPVILANGIRFTPKGLNQLFLPHGLSIAAYDDETGTIVGMAINDTECKERRCYTLSTEDKKVAGSSLLGNMFEIALATATDVRAAHDLFVRSLYADEPLMEANGPHVLPHWRDGVTFAVIAQGRSVVARSAGDVIGCALVDEYPQEFPYIYTHDEADVKFQHMFEYIERMSDIENVAPMAIEIRYLAVDQSWRGRGVARAMVEASIDVARAAGYRWMKMYTTSHFSELLIIRMKWTRLYSISYKDYVAEFNSEIKTPPEPHTRCSLYVYDLKSESN